MSFAIPRMARMETNCSLEKLMQTNYALYSLWEKSLLLGVPGAFCAWKKLVKTRPNGYKIVQSCTRWPPCCTMLPDVEQSLIAIKHRLQHRPTFLLFSGVNKNVAVVWPPCSTLLNARMLTKLRVSVSMAMIYCLYLLRALPRESLRTVPTFVTAHTFCVSRILFAL